MLRSHRQVISTQNLRRTVAALGAMVLVSGAAWAADATPVGEWLVDGAVAKIRIENCANKLWGVISWEKFPGGNDKNNPDPAKQARSSLGMPILLGMRSTGPNKWEGEIYNAENGKTYSSNISLADGNPDVLQVRGCILGFLCGGQNWTRVEPETPATGSTGAPAQATPSQRTAQAAPPTRGAPPKAGAAKTDPTKDVCAAVAADATPTRTR
jgi:uncharacterized protein (DUF2147 family)